MRIQLACTALAAILLAPAALAETKTYNLSGFSGISVSASNNVVLKQGPYSVVAESTGDFDGLRIEKDGDTLEVGREPDFKWWPGRNPRITVTVTAPDISRIHVSSSADVTTAGYSFKDVDVDVTSSGNVRLAGTCAALQLRVTSSGDFKGQDLHCETANARVSSSGDADVYATRRASGRASSSGDIRIHGQPPEVEKETSSSGSVKSL